MIYPSAFQPTAFEQFTIAPEPVKIPKCIVTFKKWMGAPVKESFGGKPIIDSGGRPVFAEMAIMLGFQRDGWETRWVETYGKSMPICLSDWKDEPYKSQVHHPFEDESIQDLLGAIANTNGGTYSGCWDVVAKKGAHVVFAESKRSKKDSIRQSQVGWLSAALKSGLRTENFLLVEWEFQL